MTRPATRYRNAALADIIHQLGWSQQQLAARFRSVAVEAGHPELASTQRSRVSMWIAGTRPSGNAPYILRETLSRGMGRPLTMTEIGFEDLDLDTASTGADPWEGDILFSLHELGRSDLVDRRHLLDVAVYSTAALALPPSVRSPRTTDRTVSSRRTRHADWADVHAIREMTAFVQDCDQRYGGSHGRTAAVAFLLDDVVPILGSTGPEQLCNALFTAAAELVYVIGWMAFDAGHHAMAQRYFILGTKLAAEAEDHALIAHLLRAMAHQALDLRHTQQAVRLSKASLHPRGFTRACPREKALLTVVHARSLAASGNHRAASAALLDAEDNLSNATHDDTEPARVWFFQQASLAHETARTLHVMGNLHRATQQFQHSVKLRNPDQFTRTHVVTLGYLAETYARRGEFEGACQIWSQTLDHLPSLQSARARHTITVMHHTLSSIRNRRIPAALELQQRLRDTPNP